MLEISFKYVGILEYVLIYTYEIFPSLTYTWISPFLLNIYIHVYIYIYIYKGILHHTHVYVCE
jgi:hypothetical protein